MSAIDFESVYRDSYRRVRALCASMVGNTPDAEDLAQEAFVQLLRKMGTFRGESAFGTWLHRLVVNVVLMWMRRKSLEAKWIVNNLGNEASGPPPPTASVRDSRLSTAVDRLNLRRAIGRLSPGYRRTLLLHDLEGYGHGEIARILGCSVGTSKSQLYHARRQMRTLLHTGAVVPRGRRRRKPASQKEKLL